MYNLRIVQRFGMDIDIKYWCGIGMEFWNDNGIEICIDIGDFMI